MNAPPRIACLHTATSNIARLERAADRPTVWRHVVREDLLQAVEREGALTDDIVASTRAAIAELCEHADGVLLTCSSLGAAVVGQGFAAPVVRPDEALARRMASRAGPRLVLVAAPTSLQPTTSLFDAQGAPFEIRLLDGAWADFRGGNEDGYRRRIAEAARKGLADGFAVVGLAQASMADALPLLDADPRVLDAPRSGYAALVDGQ